MQIQQETFADFSQFDNQKAAAAAAAAAAEEKGEASPAERKLPQAEQDSAASVSESSDKNSLSGLASTENTDSKPLPAPRHTSMLLFVTCLNGIYFFIRPKIPGLNY